jgi:GT2 family glycosyltransferase
MMSNPLVSIVIVNFNGEAFLKGCLDSVFAQTYAPFEVIVVDNASVDSSVRMLKEGFPSVRLLAQESNTGYSGGNNAGVKAALGNLIVLLNNDTVVEAGWLAGLVEACRDPDVAIASSLVITDGIPARYYERNGSINILCHNIMRVFAQPGNIFYGGGASLIFRKDVLGLPFDDEYFAYVEDLYLGLRARFMGLRIVHTNASRVRHLGSATSKRQRRAFVAYLQERNRVITALLFFDIWTLLRAAPFFLMSVFTKLLLSMGSGGQSLIAFAKAYWWILSHPGWIAQKRRALRTERRVSDREVLSWMTCKLTNGESIPGRMVNGISRIYCMCTGLRTIEFLPEGSR